VENAAIRAHIEAALARRKELFALGHLAWTVDGYTVKFRLSVVDIVRTAVEVGVFEDPVRMDRMLDEVRGSFQDLSPLGLTHL
jgi:acetolactate synthase small subunit